MSEDENKEGEWTLDDNGKALRKPNVRKLKVEIGRDPEIDSLHEDLAIARSQANEADAEAVEAAKQMLAVEAFEKQKEMALKFASPVLRDKIEGCHTPQDLESVLSGGRPAPAGKAQLLQPKGEEGVSLDDIYTILRFREKGGYSKEQISDAELKRKTLLRSMFDGESIKQMKQTGKTVYADTNMTYCPVCQRDNKRLVSINLLTQDECPVCGHKFNREERSTRV